VTISGLTLMQVLEHAVSQYDPDHPDPGGRFLQVSGLILRYDIRQSPGTRLISAYAGQPSSRDSWRPIEDGDFYKVAVPSFLAAGGDKF
jgi:hypothetical protein